MYKRQGNEDDAITSAEVWKAWERYHGRKDNRYTRRRLSREFASFMKLIYKVESSTFRDDGKSVRGYRGIMIDEDRVKESDL